MTDAPRRPAHELSTALLLDWIEGRLSPAETERIAGRVERGDSDLRERITWLRQFLRAAAELSHDSAVPPVVGQLMEQHFERWSATRRIMTDPPREFAARLWFDSRHDLAPTGTRGGANPDEAAYLAFSAGATDLLVNLQWSAANRVSLEGQILLGELDPASPIFAASVTGPDFSRRTVDGDEQGRFTLSDLPAALAELRATNGRITVTARVDLRHPEHVGT